MPGLDDVKLGYVATLDDAMEFKRWLGERHGSGAIGLDTETTGLNPYAPGAKIRLMQFGDAVTGWAISWEDWRGLALEALNAWEGDWVGHNLGAFDRKWIEHHCPYRFEDHRVHDTMIMAHIVDPLGPGGLKKLADRYVDPRSSAGEHLLAEAKMKHKWDWATVPVDFQHYWCVPTDTEILTRTGWKAYADVVPGDETLGYSDGNLVWTSISHVQTFDDAPLVRVGSSRWSTECTPQHRWLYQSPVYAQGKYAGYGPTQIAPLDEIQERKTNRLVLSGHGVGGLSRITPDEARVIAWLVTDGSIEWQRARTSPIARIYQSRHKYHDEVRDLLARVGAYVSESVRSTNAATGNENIRFYVQATYVTALWEKARLHDQTLVEFVLSLSRDARAAWLHTVVLADGVTRGPKAELPRTTVSAAVGDKHDAIVLAAYLEGHLPTMSHRKNTAIIGFGTEKRPTFQKSQPVPVGRGPVWCPVTTLGTWTARDRDGRVFVTGNTYSALDPVLTMRLHELYQKKVGLGGAYAGVYDLEMAVRHVVTRMEQHGARVDLDYSRAKYEELSSYSGKVKAWARAKHGILLSSNKQLADWFESQGEEITIFSEKTGGPSVDKQQLKIFLESENPDVIELVTQTLNMRKASKLASSYFENFLNYSVHEADGDVVHPSIKTLGARTARMSISAPALQQVPKQDATVRRSFIPRDGNKLVTVDYSQIEMRMMAHFSHDEGLIAAFAEADRTGGDFFVEIGKEVYQEPDFQKSDKRRSLLKNTAYGLCYGAGVNKMAASAGVPVDRMAAVVKGLETRFPGIRRFMREIEDLGVRRERGEGQGYVITPIGRRLPCDEGRLYTLVNYNLQSSAADVLKRAIVDLDSAGYGPYMILPVHDEVVFDLPEEHVEQALKEVPEIMADKTGFDLPLLAEAEGPYDDWGMKYASK